MYLFFDFQIFYFHFIFFYLFCSTLNREWLSDVSWTYSMYLEAVAMLPQIFMFQKQASDQGGIVEVRIFREYCSFISFYNLKYVHTTLFEALTYL